MGMPRVPEPEVMDGEAQSKAYAEADFDEVNQGFVDSLLEEFPELGPRVIDLGCGPGDIPIRLCRARGALTDVVGVDASPAMLELGRAAVREAGLTDRLRLLEAYLPFGDALLDVLGGRFDAVLSNSLLHHLPEPGALWETVKQVGRPGAAVYVMDLKRPESEQDARDIVETYAGDAPEILQRDFFASLCAAFTEDEVAAQLAEAGLQDLEIWHPTERHLIVCGVLPPDVVEGDPTEDRDAH